MNLVTPKLTAPGVYTQEVPSGSRTIVGVPTALTVFIGRTQRGPVGKAVAISSYEQFVSTFGGLLAESPMTYSVQDFFLNGGTQAVIVRVFNAQTGSPVSPPAGPGAIDPNVAMAVFSPDPATSPASPPLTPPVLLASSPGRWGTNLTFSVNTEGISPMVIARYQTRAWNAQDLFNLVVTYRDDDGSKIVETYNLVSLEKKAGARYLGTQLAQSSDLVVLGPAGSPPADPATHNPGVAESGPLSDPTFTPAFEKLLDEALDRLDVYNIVCVPPDSFDGDTLPGIYAYVAAKCQAKKATLIIDPPAKWTRASAIDPEQFAADIGVSPATAAAPFCALYYPRVVSPDPLEGGATHSRPASGIMAGIMARTDATLGVWTAPAGYSAGLANISGIEHALTDDENGVLNSIGVNCLRSFPVVGPVAWGARTLAGADLLSSDYKYLQVRRLTDYIEQTLLRQTRWAVFESNDEPLWAQLRLAIGAFMNDLWRQGAFQGSSRDKAFFVKCDAETTTQDHINRGIVNVVVGFAPLKPAEFVVIYLEQMIPQSA